MTRRVSSDVLARAWYISYASDAYALGPLRYEEPVSAERVSEDARALFAEYPVEIWPEGETVATDPYEYKVSLA